MISPPTWPPPPDVPDLLAEHDALLTDLIRAPASKSPMSRLRLVRELRQATGQDLRHCLSVVNSFCDRHGVFPERRGLRLWLAVLPALAQVGLSVVLIVSQLVQEREIDAAPTWAARRLLLGERVEWDGNLLLLIFTAGTATVAAALVNVRRTRREAEEARARVLG